MRYCSLETRKVIETIEEYGVEVPGEHYLRVEQAVGRFWNTHIQKVIKQVVTPSNVDRVDWPWLEKPIISMLTPRGGAQRTETVDIVITEHVEQVYNLVTTSLVLADFNMTELGLLTGEVATMAPDVLTLSNAIAACKKQNNRSIYYLHGVLRRDYQTRQGRIAEIQQQTTESEDRGWRIPDNYEKMDVVERMELANDWKDRLNSIQISQSLNNVEPEV
jgi:hypothetical protein